MTRIIVIILCSLILSACGESLSKEEAAFQSWTDSTYAYETQRYLSNPDMKREAYYEIKPLFDELATSIGDSRFFVDTSVFNNDTWFKDACLAYKNNIGLPILEPLKDPILGSKDTISIHGYVETKDFRTITEKHKFTVEARDSDDTILFGSNIKYPYTPQSLKAERETKHFRVVIIMDTAWNALLWEGYVLGEDHGNYDTDIPFPNDKYAPITVRVYFKPSCEFFLPEFTDLFDF